MSCMKLNNIVNQNVSGIGNDAHEFAIETSKNNDNATQEKLKLSKIIYIYLKLIMNWNKIK